MHQKLERPAYTPTMNLRRQILKKDSRGLSWKTTGLIKTDYVTNNIHLKLQNVMDTVVYSL